MKHFFLLLVLVALPLSAAERVVFVNVNVVPMDSERVIEGQDVFIADGRITGIVRHGMRGYPNDTVLIPGKDRYLVPGLAEMHSHLADPQSAFRVEDVLGLYLANGVTFARGMSGHATHVDVAKNVDDGELDGPRLMIASPAIGGWNTKSIDEARRKVNEAAEHGFSIVKLHEQLAPEVFNAAIDVARERGLLTGGHVPDSIGAEAAAKAGLGTIEHMDNFFEAGVPQEKQAEQADFFGAQVAREFDRERFSEFASRLAEQGTGVVPTYTLFENVLDPELSVDALLSREEMRYAPPEMIAQWKERAASMRAEHSEEAARHSLGERRWMLQEMHRRDVAILAGADSPQIFNVPGFSLHHELAAYVKAGLTPYEALYTATIAIGEFFGDENHGVIREGANADVILVTGNPLKDIGALRKPETVMVRGRLFTRDELDALLETAERMQE